MVEFGIVVVVEVVVVDVVVVELVVEVDVVVDDVLLPVATAVVAINPFLVETRNDPITPSEGNIVTQFSGIPAAVAMSRRMASKLLTSPSIDNNPPNQLQNDETVAVGP